MCTSAVLALLALILKPAKRYGNEAICPVDIIAARLRSPVSYENLIILTMDGADLQYVVALNKQTGKTVWKTNRSVAWNDENVPGPMRRRMAI